MIVPKKLNYNYAPGRGLMNQTAHKLRLDFFRSLAENAESIISTEISLEEVQNNIESFVGTTKIPMGLAGPLLFSTAKDKTEWIYTGICTTEGALVNIPQRDIFEFLAFTFDTNFKREQLKYFLKMHFDLVREINGDSYSWKFYIDDFIISGYEFLITRATFYLAGNTLLNYSFIKRVFICANNIIKEAKGFYE